MRIGLGLELGAGDWAGAGDRDIGLRGSVGLDMEWGWGSAGNWAGAWAMVVG